MVQELAFLTVKEEIAMIDRKLLAQRAPLFSRIGEAESFTDAVNGVVTWVQDRKAAVSQNQPQPGVFRPTWNSVMRSALDQHNKFGSGPAG